MANASVSVEVSEEIIDLLGSPEAVADRMRIALALDLLRAGQISQGRVALMLGLDRWQVLELMAEHHIQSGPASIEEADRDIASARHVSVIR